VLYPTAFDEPRLEARHCRLQPGPVAPNVQTRARETDLCSAFTRLVPPLFQARAEQEEFEHFDFDSIDDAFALVKPVKYSQSIRLPKSGWLVLHARHAAVYSALPSHLALYTRLTSTCRPSGSGITVTAYIAGHMIG